MRVFSNFNRAKIWIYIVCGRDFVGASIEPFLLWMNYCKLYQIFNTKHTHLNQLALQIIANAKHIFTCVHNHAHLHASSRYASQQSEQSATLNADVYMCAIDEDEKWKNKRREKMGIERERERAHRETTHQTMIH